MPNETASRLLQAAERILIEEGVRALSTRRVGDISGLNPTLITYHFGTVAALLTHLLDDNLTPMQKEWARLEHPVEAGKDPLETILARWLGPLLAPACYNPGGRALVVIDEIADHGEAQVSDIVIKHMAELADRVYALLAPLLPGFKKNELRMRMRFIAGATLGPPPRARLAQSGTAQSLKENALEGLLRFAIPALAEGRK